MKIPESVKLMDSGTAMLHGQYSDERAAETVCGILAAHGRTERVSPCDIVLDCSDSLRHAFITAHVEKTENGLAIMFREANGMKKGAMLALAFLFFAIAAIPSVFGMQGLILPLVLLNVPVWLCLVFRPSGACIRRMEKIISEFSAKDMQDCP